MDTFDLSSSAECKQLENLFRECVEAFRTALADHDISRLTFSMEADGRTCSGDCKITCTLQSGYGDQRVKSHSIKPLLPEMLRRHGFDEANQPLMLSSPDKSSSEDEEIPY